MRGRILQGRGPTAPSASVWVLCLKRRADGLGRGVCDTQTNILWSLSVWHSRMAKLHPGWKEVPTWSFFFLSTVSRAPPSFFLFFFFLSLSLSNSPSLSLSSCDKHQGDVTSVFGCDGRTTKRLWKSIKGGKKRVTRVFRRQMSDMDRVEGGTSCVGALPTKRQDIHRLMPQRRQAQQLSTTLSQKRCHVKAQCVTGICWQEMEFRNIYIYVYTYTHVPIIYAPSTHKHQLAKRPPFCQLMFGLCGSPIFVLMKVKGLDKVLKLNSSWCKHSRSATHGLTCSWILSG